MDVGDHEAKAALFDGFAQMAKALSTGRRIELIDVLEQGERHVEELAAEIDQSVANTSFHLRTLAGAGLVTTRRHGTRIYYQLASERVYDLWTAIRDVSVAHRARLDELVGLGRRIEIVDHGRHFAAAIRSSPAEARRELGLPDGRFDLLCIGFLQHHKGFDRAIDAMELLADPGLHLHIVGSARVDEPEIAGHVDELAYPVPVQAGKGVGGQDAGFHVFDEKTGFGVVPGDAEGRLSQVIGSE